MSESNVVASRFLFDHSCTDLAITVIGVNYYYYFFSMPECLSLPLPSSPWHCFTCIQSSMMHLVRAVLSVPSVC